MPDERAGRRSRRPLLLALHVCGSSSAPPTTPDVCVLVPCREPPPALMLVTVNPFLRGGVICTELVIETLVHSRDLAALPFIGAGEFRPDCAELAAPRGALAALAGARVTVVGVAVRDEEDRVQSASALAEGPTGESHAFVVHARAEACPKLFAYVAVLEEALDGDAHGVIKRHAIVLREFLGRHRTSNGSAASPFEIRRHSLPGSKVIAILLLGSAVVNLTVRANLLRLVSAVERRLGLHEVTTETFVHGGSLGQDRR